jgi:hypothetical protein
MRRFRRLLTTIPGALRNAWPRASFRLTPKLPGGINWICYGLQKPSCGSNRDSKGGRMRFAPLLTTRQRFVLLCRAEPRTFTTKE